MKVGVELEDYQKEVFEKLETLFGKEEKGGWKHLESPYEGVKMEIKYQQQKEGERSISLGRAEGVIDATAEEVAAWQFQSCSRERNRAGYSAGDLARLVLRKRHERVNETQIATVKKFPIFMHNREFVWRSIWNRNVDGSITLASQNLDTKVDYGGDNLGSIVRGIGNGMTTVSNKALVECHSAK